MRLLNPSVEFPRPNRSLMLPAWHWIRRAAPGFQPKALAWGKTTCPLQGLLNRNGIASFIRQSGCSSEKVLEARGTIAIQQVTYFRRQGSKQARPMLCAPLTDPGVKQFSPGLFTATRSRHPLGRSCLPQRCNRAACRQHGPTGRQTCARPSLGSKSSSDKESNKPRAVARSKFLDPAKQLFQSSLFAFSVEGGLINSQDFGRFGQVGGSFQNYAKVRRLQLQDQLVHIAASVPGMIHSLRLRPDGSTRKITRGNTLPFVGIIS